MRANSPIELCITTRTCGHAIVRRQTPRRSGTFINFSGAVNASGTINKMIQLTLSGHRTLTTIRLLLPASVLYSWWRKLMRRFIYAYVSVLILEKVLKKLPCPLCCRSSLNLLCDEFVWICTWRGWIEFRYDTYSWMRKNNNKQITSQADGQKIKTRWRETAV